MLYTFNQTDFHVLRYGNGFRISVKASASAKAWCIVGFILVKKGDGRFSIESEKDDAAYAVSRADILREIYHYFEYERQTIRQAEREEKFDAVSLMAAMSLNVEGLRDIYLGKYWNFKPLKHSAEN